MLNWTCTDCNELNSPRKEICWHCGNGRFHTKTQIMPNSLQIFKIVGAMGAVALIGSLFLPWAVRTTPSGEITQFAGHVSIFGKIIIGLALLILFLMSRKQLAFSWYVFIILLALVPLLFSAVPAELIQVEDMIIAELAGVETVAQTVPGSGVTVANGAAITMIISAIAQLFRQKKAASASGELALQQG